MKIYFHILELRSNFSELDRLMDTVNRNFFMMYKYRLMWNLRHLENQINSEGGIIVFDQELNVTAKGFTPELTQQIEAICISCRNNDKDT